MFKKLLSVACALALAIGVAYAGEVAKPATGAKPAMDAAAMAAMKAEFMKCAVCKNMASDLEVLWPVMTMDVARLNDGVAMMHGVSDPSKADRFHAACRAMNKAGEACMTMTDEQAKTGLCEFCQEFRGVMKAGAKMSHGETKTGDVMVLTSSDPALKARLDGMATKCELMMASMGTTGSTASR